MSETPCDIRIWYGQRPEDDQSDTFRFYIYSPNEIEERSLRVREAPRTDKKDICIFYELNATEDNDYYELLIEKYQLSKDKNYDLEICDIEGCCYMLEFCIADPKDIVKW